MKYLIPLLFILASCNQATIRPTVDESGSTTKQAINTSGEKLFENGFLKYCDSLKFDTLKYALLKSFSIYDEATNRFATIDAEELAEFSFDFFMPQLNKILRKRGIEIEVNPSIDYQQSHEIVLDGEKIKLYTDEELNNYNYWDAAPRNFFRKLNEHLLIKGSKEKFYLLYSGNDLSVLLLEASQFEIIKEKYKDDVNEIPYLP